MNKFLYFLSGMVLLLASCADISETERLIYVKPADVARSVLIEDFTGQRCMHCPKAAQEIERLQAEYGAETVVAVAIHAGQLAVKKSELPEGLATDDGETYYKHWNVEAPPVGVINRSGAPMYIAQWGAQVHKEVQKPAQVALAMTNDYKDKECTAAIDITLQEAESMEGNLQVWVVEDGIVAPQKQPDGSFKMDYVHNHVFRAAVNGTWGDKLKLESGKTVHKEYTIRMNEEWKPEHISIVAFVYNHAGVCQVIKKKVITK